MAIKDKDYASFLIDVEEHRNKVTGKIDKIDVDFTDTKEATGKDEEGTPIKVVDIKELTTLCALWLTHIHILVDL